MDDAAILNVVLDHVGRVMLLMRSEVPEAFDLNAVRYRTARPLKSRVDKVNKVLMMSSLRGRVFEYVTFK